MAGISVHPDGCGNGIENQQFHLEMENVASGRDFIQLNPKESFELNIAKNPQGSTLSLDVNYLGQKSDSLPLTGTHPCIYEECTKFHNINKSEQASPVSPLKNIFLYLVLLMLLLWILAYTILSKMHYL